MLASSSNCGDAPKQVGSRTEMKGTSASKGRKSGAPGIQRPGGRTERNRLAVAEAVLAMLHRGDTELNAADVSDESGVSVSTIYRRWPTRADLLAEAGDFHTRALHAPDTGSFESDVHALARHLAHFCSDPTEIALTTGVVAHGDGDLQSLMESRTPLVAKQLTRPFEVAVERGECSPDVDPEILLEQIVCPMIVRTVVLKQPLSGNFVRKLADHVIRSARD